MTASIIIPTTCELKRTDQLRRAIASVLEQDVPVELIVVVNGDRRDAALFAELCARTDLLLIERAEGNVSAARYAGLQASAGEFFGFLDDDDEYLPGAVSMRLARFTEGIDVVVTNGYHFDGKDQPLVSKSVAAEANSDPLGSFLAANWFASPGSMFRAATVDRSLFDINLKFFEWTLLFFLLIAKHGKRIRYDDCLTYRIYEDNPLSVSKTAEYAAAYPAFLMLLLAFDVSRKHRDALAAKYVVALNGLAQLELARGNCAAAWRAHLKCLTNGGMRYLPYTRHLLR